jgi:signal transduction histidine kinase
MAGRGEVTAAELTEVPLMAGMFLAMVWHARRRQAAVEELRRTGEREREFIRDASHQLRTPITIARIHAELIRDADADSAVHGDAAVVLDELTTLGTIAERLLLLAAAEHADFLVRRPIDSEALVVSVARRWAANGSRRWLVDVDVEGTLVGDRDRLVTALDALLENAVKFTREGDQIKIRGFRDGGDAVIEIADTGVGIAHDHLDRIFERFAVVEGEPGHGTGLGLSIVKTIVEAHRGSISVASSPGRGATFRVRLPGLGSVGALGPSLPATPLSFGEPAPDFP